MSGSSLFSGSTQGSSLGRLIKVRLVNGELCLVVAKSIERVEVCAKNDSSFTLRVSTIYDLFDVGEFKTRPDAEKRLLELAREIDDKQ